MTLEKLVSAGSVVLQGNSYRIVADGLEVWSDGSARWSLDRAARELLIESVVGAGVDSNPVLFLSCLEEAFARKALGVKTFDGRACHAFLLTPVAGRSSSLSKVLLYFQGQAPCGAELSMSDGHTARVLLDAFRLLDAEPAAAFRFNPASLDKSFVVTDLR